VLWWVVENATCKRGRGERESVSGDRLGDSPFKNIEQEPGRGEFIIIGIRVSVRGTNDLIPKIG